MPRGTPAGTYRRWSEFPTRAASRGHLVFLVDVRGRYESDGQFEAYRQEKRDGGALNYTWFEWFMRGASGITTRPNRS